MIASIDGPAGLRLEAPERSAGAAAAVGDHVDVPDVAGVATGAVEQPAVEHDPAADPGRHDHRQVVGLPLRRSAPSLAERQRLGVVVDEGRQPARSLDHRPQREPAPAGDVERRHLLATGPHRPATPDPAGDQAVVVTGVAHGLLDHLGQPRPRIVGDGGAPTTGDDLARLVDDPDDELRAPDVDRQPPAHEPDGNRLSRAVYGVGS